MGNLNEEDVFSNDVDPLDGIREARKAMEAEGSNEEPEEQEEEQESSDETESPANEEENGTDNEQEESEQEEDEESESAESSESSDSSSDEEQEGQDEKVEDKPLATADLNEVRKYKANGQEYEFTVQEILDQFGVVFGKSVDYTQKTQKIAPFRKMISALEEEGITHDQLNVAIDALKGDKGAIKQLMDNHDISGYDLNEDHDYKANSYGADDGMLDLQETVNRINQDPEYVQTSQVVTGWDRNSQATFASKPQMLEGLHNDIKSGLFAKVQAIAAKMKVLDGNTKSDLEYYMHAGQQYKQQQEKADTAKSQVNELNAKSKAEIDKAGKASSEASKRRSAASTSTRVDKTVTNYLDDDDEKFDDWYKNLMSSS